MLLRYSGRFLSVFFLFFFIVSVIFFYHIFSVIIETGNCGGRMGSGWSQTIAGPPNTIGGIRKLLSFSLTMV